MNGEPIAACNSISDQSPCMAGEPRLAMQTYCPQTMPGYPGLYGGLGVLPGEGSGADITGVISRSDDGVWCYLAGGLAVPCSTILDWIGTGRDIKQAEILRNLKVAALTTPPPPPPADEKEFDWTPLMWGAGAVIAALVVVSMARR